jgi:hypothetical protein
LSIQLFLLPHELSPTLVLSQRARVALLVAIPEKAEKDAKVEEKLLLS